MNPKFSNPSAPKPQERLNGQGHGRRGRASEAFGESEAAKRKRGLAKGNGGVREERRHDDVVKEIYEVYIYICYVIYIYIYIHMLFTYIE